MFCTGTGDPAGKDLTTIGNESSQRIRGLVVCFQVLGTESADFPSKHISSSAGSASRSFTIFSTLAIRSLTAFTPGGSCIFAHCFISLSHSFSSKGDVIIKTFRSCIVVLRFLCITVCSRLSVISRFAARLSRPCPSALRRRVPQ